MCRLYALPATLLVSWVLCQAVVSAAAEVKEEKQAQPAATPAAVIPWNTDYAKAVGQSQRQNKMLLIYFFDGADELCRRFEAETLGDAAISARLKQDFVCLRLPPDAKVHTEQGEVKLLGHESFAEMLGRPGVAMIDFAHADANLHGYVVSAFPLTQTLFYAPQEMAVILDLPAGTLTQRTLIYAVRVHPEHPASTSGQFHPQLAVEAQSHSQNQACMRLQGHHGWETRFHRINAILPAGMTAREVCAESWPGQRLLEAAIECVRCWRCSSGHWSAVRAGHCVYAYDMKCGCNGVWYATGIFASQ
jgi:hypothetical protein